MPNIRGCSGNGICFNISLLPVYLKHAKKHRKVSTMAVYLRKAIS
ncbi:MAG: hypothetical protein ACTS73_07020 [Arsenophonus sp. NEOnobi-MAG3]